MPENNNNVGSGPAWPWAALPAYRADYRARNPVPDPIAVSAELAERKQWLVWGYRPGETEEKKYRKMPHYADGGRRAGGQGSEEDRRRLVTLAAAVNAVSRGDFDGVGFAFLPDDGLIGIDLDGMIDPESGEVSERCEKIIAACATYTEYSPSGKGVHIIGFGQIEKSTKSNDIGVEMFCGSQFFTFTGRPWPGGGLAVQQIPERTLARIEKTIGGAKKARQLGASGAEPDSIPHALPTVPPRTGGKPRSLAETVAMAEEAVGFLSPDDYTQWIEIGMACKAGLGSAGYLIWDAWSSKSAKYAGEADTARRWKTFKPSTISLAALFSRAEAQGWESPWAKAEKRKLARKPKPAQAAAPEYDYGQASADPSPPPAPPPDTSETHFDATKAPAEEGGYSPPGEPPEDDDEWRKWLVRKSGDTTSCLANAELILSHLKPWQGAIGYDEFAERTMFRKRLPCDPCGPVTGVWSDHLDSMTAIWLQRSWRVEFSPKTVLQAVEVVAQKNKFHPVREALAELAPWDGISRNGDWLSDYLGVKKTPYSELVGRFFLRAMIKRVMEPGCKFDYCLVLEGEQGLGKSTAARILAWRWFADTDLDLSNKDALMALAGHWVYEISEMGSLMRAEEKKQKSFLSRQDDEYRPPYGRRMIKVARQSVFIGTTNEEEYLKDATGGRRFWPVLCESEFNLDGLRENMPQMYAEALADYHAKEQCWPSNEEQTSLFTPEQVKRGMQEPFDDLLYNWVKSQAVPFSMAEAATDGLKLTADKLTPAIVTRLGISLRRLGCGRKEDRLAADPSRRRLYVPPKLRVVAGVVIGKDEGGNDVYF